jgi:hypothetical protein
LYAGHRIWTFDAACQGKKLLVWGDVVHVAAIQFPDPSATVTYDNDDNQAEADRERIFSDGRRHFVQTMRLMEKTELRPMRTVRAAVWPAAFAKQEGIAIEAVEIDPGETKCPSLKC